MKSLIFASLGLAASLFLQPALGPAQAGVLFVSGEQQEKPPEELAREGIEKLMRALELLIEEIPQYEMPEINENGDIIIRRKNPPKPEDKPEDKIEETAEPESTDT